MFTFLLSSVSMRINVLPPPPLLYIYIPHIVMIFFYIPANVQLLRRVHFVSHPWQHTKNKLKSTCHCLPLCWPGPLYIYLFWYHPAAFLFLDPGYCCAVTNAHWGAIGRIKSTKLLLAMNYVLIGRVFGEVKPGMIMKSAIVVMPFKLFQIIFMYH